MALLLVQSSLLWETTRRVGVRHDFTYGQSA